ncbi:MAG: hypothetical protein A3G08_03845 [Candidatus Magasanikbacteria bacterium RIFCSPLOWO2_12_FULL_47_9b]|nr:MAG: hypothetical protein A3G08_03845 [Candidatus Magasanikbacteria bacterium RIFCSPLOWO2_12_FULL_47_9b]
MGGEIFIQRKVSTNVFPSATHKRGRGKYTGYPAFSHSSNVVIGVGIAGLAFGFPKPYMIYTTKPADTIRSTIMYMKNLFHFIFV